MSKNIVTLKPGSGALKVIGTDTYQSATYDFLLTFHGNHGPISYRFPDKRRFQSKIANFSHRRVFCAPADGVPMGIEHRRSGSKTKSWGYRAEKEV